MSATSQSEQVVPEFVPTIPHGRERRRTVFCSSCGKAIADDARPAFVGGDVDGYVEIEIGDSDDETSQLFMACRYDGTWYLQPYTDEVDWNRPLRQSPNLQAHLDYLAALEQSRAGHPTSCGSAWYIQAQLRSPRLSEVTVT
jgi:hypothetical protein